MRYDVKCEGCGDEIEVTCSLEEHEWRIKPGFKCACGALYKQVFNAPRSVFAREGFPKGDPRWEHVTPDPVYIRDKYHLRDLCQEQGAVSHFLENDM